MSPQERFGHLATAMLEQAERIDCSIPEYIDGLTNMILHLQDAKSAAEEAHRATGG